MELAAFLVCVVLISLLAAFVLTLARKWGVIEWVQVHGNDLFCRLASCDFCLSWWVCVALAVVIAIFVSEPVLLLAPFCATIITRNLL